MIEHSRNRWLRLTLEAAVDRALKESLAEADMRPAEAYAGLTPVFVDGDTPQIREGDMVIVKLDPSLCETFIPPATRAQKMAINVHLYDTYHHHRDVGERVYQPLFVMQRTTRRYTLPPSEERW